VGRCCREVVEEEIAEEERIARIPTASRDYLLLQKAESFVSRRIVKSRNAFDIRLLLAQGAKLDEVLKSHLHDALLWREMKPEEIGEGIEKLDAKLCRAELKPGLPDEVYAELEREGVESLRAAMRIVFAEWL
jgi:hypothetical protein